MKRPWRVRLQFSDGEAFTDSTFATEDAARTRAARLRSILREGISVSVERKPEA